MELESFKFLTAVEIFLLSEDEKEILLIHRSKEKEYLPDYYAGLGGKMDSLDNETPLDAAYREIQEESGYHKEEIQNLKLKGIITVYDRFGKWIVYEFVGKINKKKFEAKQEMNEGTLEWLNFSQFKGLKLIQDLRNGILEKIVLSHKFLWMKSVYNKDDKLVHFELKEV